MGYGRLEPRVDAFLGSIGLPISHLRATHRAWAYMRDGFAYLSAYTLRPGQPSPGSATFLRHTCYYASRTSIGSCARPNRLTPKGSISGIQTLSITGLAWAVLRRYGNINPLSIDYACRPRLRSRLTQGGLAWPWNPWSFGGRVSHPSFATHACILTRVASTAGSHRRFTRHTTLSYPSTRLDHEGLPLMSMPQLRWRA